MDSKFGVSNINYCRLCASTNDDPLNIFSEIGIELQMREIISEHFQCDVDYKTYFLKFITQCHGGFHFFFSFLHFNYRLVKPMPYQISFALSAGQ